MSGPTLTIPVHLEIQGLTMTGLQMAAEIFTDEMRLAFDDIGQHVSEQVKEYILNLKNAHGGPALHNTGDLINSITWALDTSRSLPGVAVGTNLFYAKFQELGTVPHFVPFSMAPSLEVQARREWGWLPVTKSQGKMLAGKGPGKAVSEGPGKFKQITGKHKTYLTMSTDKVWLRPKAGAKPVWGVRVSGKAQPFIYPAWEMSQAWCEERLIAAAQRAGERINSGGA